MMNALITIGAILVVLGVNYFFMMLKLSKSRARASTDHSFKLYLKTANDRIRDYVRLGLQISS